MSRTLHALIKLTQLIFNATPASHLGYFRLGDSGAHNLDTTTAQFSNGILYERSGERLTDVPDDIPDNTTRVQLSFNHIQTVRRRAFSHLSLCFQLNLRENLINEIERKAFYGLKSLKTLDLSYNRLKVKQENRPVLTNQ